MNERVPPPTLKPERHGNKDSFQVKRQHNQHDSTTSSVQLFVLFLEKAETQTTKLNFIVHVSRETQANAEAKLPKLRSRKKTAALTF